MRGSAVVKHRSSDSSFLSLPVSVEAHVPTGHASIRTLLRAFRGSVHVGVRPEGGAAISTADLPGQLRTGDCPSPLEA